MCGISGYISEKKLVREGAIRRTLHLMKRRGPDSQGYQKFNESKKEVNLIHSRLNIIDVKKRSNQPFIEGQFSIIFNGEIYNYIELRNELIKKKYKFKTNSDTEVLLKSYIEYGEKCVEKFIGMWAFAIWDNKKKKLFISRDIFGEKPLYYFYSRGGFFFGSEIKFIKSLAKFDFKINKEQVYNNLFYGYKSQFKTNKTFYKNIYALENATNIIIDLNLRIKKKVYWKPNININYNLKRNDAENELKRLLQNSLNLRLRSDVPVSFCLSGGVDSGILASIAKKKLNRNISTFSIIDNDERYNEKNNIKSIVNDLKCKNNLIYLNNKKNDFFSRIKKLTNYHDGPIATSSYYVHSFLSEEISKKNFKVAISGTGADEIFSGYYDHYLLHLASIKSKKLFNDNLNSWYKHIYPIIRNPYLKDPFIYIKNPKNRDMVYESNFKLNRFAFKKKNTKFFEKNYCNELLRKRMLNELFFEIVPVILKHDDLNSMYYSIENRSPYLDKEILNFALTLPPSLLIQDGYQKKILRDSYKGILNSNIRQDRIKKGFNASISSLVNLQNKKEVNKVFDKKKPIYEFIDLNKLKEKINFQSIPNHYSKLIFSIITTNIFLEENNY